MLDRGYSDCQFVKYWENTLIAVSKSNPEFYVKGMNRAIRKLINGAQSALPGPGLELAKRGTGAA